jgi:putative heme-binding domain-containing protein
MRALRSAGVDLVDRAAPLAHDPSPAVRRELALALVGSERDGVEDACVVLARGFDGEDRAYLEALGLASAGREETLWPRLAAEQGDVPARWSARFAGLAWRLHPPAAVPGLAARALDATLAPEARRRAVDALAFVHAREAGEALLEVALAGPADVRPLALWWIRHRDENDWRAWHLADELPGAGEAEVVWTSGLLSLGTVDLDVDLPGANGGARALHLVVDPGDDGNGCDWADWIEPRLVLADGELRLTELPWRSAEAEWGAVRVGANAAGGPLAVGGVPVAWGIGTHARSRIVWDLPAGALRLRARAGPDDGGTTQPGGRTSLEFRVALERPPDRARLEALVRALDDEALAPAARADAARELARDPEGALRLIRRAEAGALAPEHAAAAAEAIEENPDLGVRALASRAFPRLRKRVADALPALAKVEGDPERGRALYFDERTRCATCHLFDGEGGALGPELTRIREKLGPAALLDAIRRPSDGIAAGFEAWILETEDGRLVSGFVLADGERVVVKDTQGVRHVLDAAEIVERVPQSVSTMPAGLLDGLAPGEVASLVAFLSADPDAPPVFGDEVALLGASVLDGWAYHLADPDARPADVWTLADGVLTCTGSPAGYLRTEADYTSFELELEWRFLPEKGPGNSGVLLRMTGPDEVWPRSIEAQLHHRDAGDIWNIGAVPMRTAPERTQGRRTARMWPSSEKPLGEWNRYRIRLDGPELVLEVNGVVQNVARGCEVVPGKICLQSEGAWIQFQNVRLRPIVR